MKQKTVKTIAIVLVIAMVITSFSFVVFLPSVFGATSDEKANQRLEVLADYIEYVKNTYKDEITYDTLINGAFDGVTKALNDPYSIYYSDVKMAEEFKTSVDNTFYGIGVEIKKHEKGIIVINAIAGSPAYKAGIRNDDVIIKIDGLNIANKSLEEAVSLLRGEKGTSVSVTLERNKNEQTYNIIRDKINDSSVVFKSLENSVGYIHITGFDADTEIEFSQALSEIKAQGAKRLVLDLRYNPGGYISKAEIIADQLLENCNIVFYENQGEIIQTVKANNGKKEDMPIVVIVNGETASAAELLAAALDENGAMLVGTKTYGKGIAQSMLTLTDGRQAKLTQYYFLTPSKKNYDGKGITPEFYVKNYASEGMDLHELQNQYNSFAPMSEQIKYGLGSVGLNVYGAQQRLSMLGYDVSNNGQVDDKTFSAIKKFQADTGLYPYGTLDLTTAKRVDEEAYKYAVGYVENDLQLEKAIELVKTK